MNCPCLLNPLRVEGAHARCTMTDEASTDERLWRWQRTLSARVADASWWSRTAPGDDGATAAARRWSKGLVVVRTTLSEADGGPSPLATGLRAEDRSGPRAEQGLTWDLGCGIALLRGTRMMSLPLARERKVSPVGRIGKGILRPLPNRHDLAAAQLVTHDELTTLCSRPSWFA